MTNNTVFAILGAGHGGYAMSADLTLGGFETRLYELPKYESNITPIKEKGGIQITGDARKGFAKIAMATTDIKEAVAGANVVMITTPAFGHEAFVDNLLPCLEDGQVVIFNTGYYACLRFAKKLKAKRKVKVAETVMLVYSCRRTVGSAEVDVDGMKRELLIAALPATDTPSVLDVLEGGKVFGGNPRFMGAENVLKIDLENLNMVFHPAITLMNTALIERTKGDFIFYKDGVTPAVGRIIQAVADEREAVGKALGIGLTSPTDWLRMYYGARGKDIYEAIQDCKPYIDPHERGPRDFSFRYMTEDVPFGLVPTSSIGRLLKVATPTIDSEIQLASVINKIDYQVAGNNAEKMGLSGMTARQIMDYAGHA